MEDSQGNFKKGDLGNERPTCRSEKKKISITGGLLPFVVQFKLAGFVQLRSGVNKSTMITLMVKPLGPAVNCGTNNWTGSGPLLSARSTQYGSTNPDID